MLIRPSVAVKYESFDIIMIRFIHCIEVYPTLAIVVEACLRNVD